MIHFRILHKITPEGTTPSVIKDGLLLMTLLLSFFYPILGLIFGVLPAAYQYLYLRGASEAMMFRLDKLGEMFVIDGVMCRYIPDKYLVDNMHGRAFCSFDRVYMSDRFRESDSILQHEIYHAKSNYSLRLLWRKVGLTYLSVIIVTYLLHTINPVLAILLTVVLEIFVLAMLNVLCKSEETNADRRGILLSYDEDLLTFVRNNKVNGFFMTLLFTAYEPYDTRINNIKYFIQERSKYMLRREADFALSNPK